MGLDLRRWWRYAQAKLDDATRAGHRELDQLEAERAAAAADVADVTTTSDEAEQAAARLEVDRRAREAQERLAAIRDELGVDPPPADPR